MANLSTRKHKLCVEGPKVNDRCRCLRCGRTGTVGPYRDSHWMFYIAEEGEVVCDICTLQKMLNPGGGICNWDVVLISPALRFADFR